MTDGHNALTGAPWYPAQTGDRLLVTYEETGHDPRWTETYEVAEDATCGRVLRHVEHTAPDDSLAGWFAGPPELHDGDPFETPWMEAGPDRLTITRDGAIVHQGHHALPRPDTAAVRLTTAASADGDGLVLAVVREREYTPAELDELMQKTIARGQEAAARHDARRATETEQPRQ
ncbi:hypothetical protein AB0H73_35700 [Streptomyces olivoreticuli]